MEKGCLRPSTVEQKLYLAYLRLHHAQEVQDYIQALDYLEGAFQDGPYSTDALELLGWIFTSNSEGVDSSGFADSVRLFAAWLMGDNAARNVRKWPELSSDCMQDPQKPDRESPSVYWEYYWSGKLVWNEEKEQVVGSQEKRNVSIEVSELIQHYVARSSTVPAAGRIDRRLDGQAWLDFGIESWGEMRSFLSQGTGFDPRRRIGRWSIDVLARAFSDTQDLRDKQLSWRPYLDRLAGTEAEQHLPLIRADPQEWKRSFLELRELAIGGPKELREALLLHLQVLISDPDPGNTTLNLYLIACLLDLDPRLKSMEEKFQFIAIHLFKKRRAS